MKNKRRPFICTGILLAISVVIFIFGLNETWVYHYYSNGIYQPIAISLRWISSLFPFALGDILYGLLILFAGWKLILFIKRRKQLRKTGRVLILLKISNLILLLYISFKLLWGLNYSRPSIAAQLNITD